LNKKQKASVPHGGLSFFYGMNILPRPNGVIPAETKTFSLWPTWTPARIPQRTVIAKGAGEPFQREWI
jgi:hypothetical protein